MLKALLEMDLYVMEVELLFTGSLDLMLEGVDVQWGMNTMNLTIKFGQFSRLDKSKWEYLDGIHSPNKQTLNIPSERILMVPPNHIELKNNLKSVRNKRTKQRDNKIKEKTSHLH